MKRIFLYIVVLSFILGNTSLKGQQDMQFSHYMFNGLFYNPGYAGIDNLPKATFIHRTQWAGYSGYDGAGAPSTQILSLATPLSYFSPDKLSNQGLGINVVMDKIGAMNNTNLNVSYGRQFEMNSWGEQDLLSVGVKLGFWSQKIDTDILRYGDLDDQTLDNMVANGASQMKPDISIGAFWKATKGHYAGLAFNHAIRPNFDFNSDASSKIARHMYLQGGYKIGLKDDAIIISPSTILMTDFRRVTYNLGGITKFVKEKFDWWSGMTFRQSIAQSSTNPDKNGLNNDAITLIVGGAFIQSKAGESSEGHKKLRISYAFDFVTTGLAAKKRTSHEVKLSYIFPLEKITHQTPRYIRDEIESSNKANRWDFADM